MLSNKDNVIYYVAVSNLIDRKILVDYSPKDFKVNNKKYKKDTREMIDKLILIAINPNERQTEKISSEQKIISIVDKNARWVFLSLISSSFPERIGYRMLNELENKYLNNINELFLESLGNFNHEDDSSQKHLKDNIQLTMVELLQKYNELGSVDKITEIQEEVDSTKVVMKDNINQMIVNLDNFEKLEGQTDLLKMRALEFKDNTKEVKKASAWGNKKMTIAVGGIGATAILLLILKFIL